jgi:hypothetical protein
VGGIARCGLLGLRQDELLVAREFGPERLALRGESAELVYVQSRSPAGNLNDGSVQGDLIVECRRAPGDAVRPTMAASIMSPEARSTTREITPWWGK